MDINEAFRRIVAGHLRLLTLFVVLPIAAMLAVSSTGHARFVASARIQASSATIGSDTEADSVLNRVKGVATSTTLITKALSAANINNRSVDTIVKEITVTRLGSSAVMDLAVTDASPGVARNLSTALATAVVGFIGGQGSQQQQDLLTQLNGQQTTLYTQREQLVSQLTRASGTPGAASVSAQLSTTDQELSDVTATLRQLQVTIATGTSASLISPADPAKLVRTGLTTELVLAGIGGLVAGLLGASILEVIRPRVADARAFARELGVPLLGGLSPRPHPRRFFARVSPWRRHRPDVRVDSGGPGRPVLADAETLLALRQAAAKSRVHTLALISDADAFSRSDLASRLTARLTTHDGAAHNGNGAAHNGNGTGHNGAGHNGHGTAPGVLVNAAPELSGGSATSRLRTQMRDLRSFDVAVPLRVIPYAELDEGQAGAACGLLVVAGKLTRYGQLHRVQDIAAASGWPVLGVLADRSRSRRRQS